MRLKQIAASVSVALALTVGGTAAHAIPASQVLTASHEITFNSVLSSSTFEEAYQFTLGSGGSILGLSAADGELTAFNAWLTSSAGNIAATSVVLTTNPITLLSKATYQFNGLATGAYTLHLSATGDEGTMFSTVLSVSAVPEPESFAMMLAGLGLIGGIARRRKSVAPAA